MVFQDVTLFQDMIRMVFQKVFAYVGLLNKPSAKVVDFAPLGHFLVPEHRIPSWLIFKVGFCFEDHPRIA